VSGLLSGVIFLFSCFAMLWGGEVVAPFLATALALPSFLLLYLGSARLLAGFLWFLTAASSITFCLAVRTDDVISHSWKIFFSTDSIQLLFNQFTLYMVCISAIVQLAATCRTQRERQLKSAKA